MSEPWQFWPQARAARVIGLARLTLAVSSLATISLHPSVPTEYEYITRTLALAYAAVAIVLLPLVWRATVMRQRWQLVLHVFDLTAASLFIALTAGTDSLFFPYLVFTLVSASLRWDSGGLMWTGLAVLVVSCAAFFVQLTTDSPPTANVFVIRTTSLVVLVLMLRHLSRYGAHVRDTLQRLRTWQPAVGNEPGTVIRDAVRYAANVLGAPRAAFVWEDPDEPDVRMTWWAGGEVSVRREHANTFEPLVATPYQDVDFLCRDVTTARPAVVFTARGGLATGSTPPVHREFIARFGIRTLISVRCGPGRLFVVDRPQPTADELALAQTVARQVSSSLDQVLLLQRLEDASHAEARGRVARDLHDGILQSLTAVTLRLQVIGRALDEGTRVRIEAIQAVIRDEASRLRRFIQELTVPVSGIGSDLPTLAVELDLLRHQLKRDWGLSVELATTDLARIPPHVIRDVYFLLREALINVARHAGTSEARAAVAADGQRLTITVADAGRGFFFRGRYEGAELLAMNGAPRMLYQRVASLGGRLVVESRANGTRVDIELPLAEKTAG